MKYIRTKDGNLFRVWNWWNNSGSIPEPDVETIGCYVGNGKDISIDDILNQADTIEELCDEFVRVSKSVNDFLVSDDIPTKKFGDTEIYGAIWTSKGLIYVAKMNDKGELELL